MMLLSVGNSNYVDSMPWAANLLGIDILVGRSVIHDPTETAQYFIFDVIGDVIDGLKALFPSTNLADYLTPFKICKST